MIKCGKSCKEKGRERPEIFNNRDDFKTEMRADLFYTKCNLFHTPSLSRSGISYS